MLPLTCKIAIDFLFISHKARKVYDGILSPYLPEAKKHIYTVYFISILLRILNLQLIHQYILLIKSYQLSGKEVNFEDSGLPSHLTVSSLANSFIPLSFILVLNFSIGYIIKNAISEYKLIHMIYILLYKEITEK